MTNAEKSLCGGSIEIDEIDDEDQLPKDMISNIYNMDSVINSIRTENFKTMWNMNIPEIQKLSVDEQRDFCYKITDTIKSNYNIDICDYISLYEMTDFTHLYQTIYFIEYEVINFLANFIKFLNVDIMINDLSRVFSNNFNLIESYINYVMKNRQYLKNKILSKILLTYNKEDISKLFEKKYIENKMDILLKSKNLD